ncbi:MAG: hypothetical protein K2Q34_01760 [Alphaproteobacteria bacterium]|nr:hypothetical protein [Alphaproteobacteria bacterium]
MTKKTMFTLFLTTVISSGTVFAAEDLFSPPTKQKLASYKGTPELEREIVAGLPVDLMSPGEIAHHTKMGLTTARHARDEEKEAIKRDKKAQASEQQRAREKEEILKREAEKTQKLSDQIAALKITLESNATDKARTTQQASALVLRIQELEREQAEMKRKIEDEKRMLEETSRREKAELEEASRREKTELEEKARREIEALETRSMREKAELEDKSRLETTALLREAEEKNKQETERLLREAEEKGVSETTALLREAEEKSVRERERLLKEAEEKSIREKAELEEKSIREKTELEEKSKQEQEALQKRIEEEKAKRALLTRSSKEALEIMERRYETTKRTTALLEAERDELLKTTMYLEASNSGAQERIAMYSRLLEEMPSLHSVGVVAGLEDGKDPLVVSTPVSVSSSKGGVGGTDGRSSIGSSSVPSSGGSSLLGGTDFRAAARGKKDKK